VKDSGYNHISGVITIMEQQQLPVPDKSVDAMPLEKHDRAQNTLDLLSVVYNFPSNQLI
jgi:hypothetical protein